MISDSSARPVSLGMERIRARLMETPTKISPINPAAALPMSIKKLLQPFIYIIDRLAKIKQFGHFCAYALSLHLGFDFVKITLFRAVFYDAFF